MFLTIRNWDKAGAYATYTSEVKLRLDCSCHIHSLSQDPILVKWNISEQPDNNRASVH